MVRRSPTGQILPGSTANPAGRKKGALSNPEVFDRSHAEIAEELGIKVTLVQSAERTALVKARRYFERLGLNTPDAFHEGRAAEPDPWGPS